MFYFTRYTQNIRGKIAHYYCRKWKGVIEKQERESKSKSMYIQYCTNWWYKHLKVVIWIILYLKRSLVEYLAIYIYQTCNLVLLASTLNHIGVTLPTRYYCFKHINVYVENLLRYYVVKNWNWMFKKKLWP